MVMWRYAKPTAMMLLVCCSVAHASAQGQDSGVAPSLLDRPSHLEIRNLTSVDALRELQRLSAVFFAYSPDLLRTDNRVSCDCAAATVRQALDSVLAGTGLRYEESGNRVLLRPESTASLAAQSDSREQQEGMIVGEVRSAVDSIPIGDARVQVVGVPGEVRTSSGGEFRLHLAPGSYELIVRALGFAPRELEPLSVAERRTRNVTVLLEPAPLRLSEIVVTPGTYGILREASVIGEQTLSSNYVHALPRLGDDVYRAVDRLPGIATHDITAKIHVRGAPDDQVLVELDGLELLEPYHLKDWDGSLSIIDVESIGDINLMTGGFTAEYGDKMTGVFSMKTTTPPPGRTRTTIGFSVMNLTAKSEGGFGGGRGTWLASGRYGFMGPVLKIIGEANGAEPTYYDVFGKVQYQLSSRHLISGHVLHAGDDFSIVEEDGTDVASKWGSSYAWLSWDADLLNSLSARTIVSAGAVTKERTGLDYQGFPSPVVSVRVNDRSPYKFVGLKQNWNLMVSDRLLVKWGVDFRAGWAEYDYYRWQADWVPNVDNPGAPAWERETSSFAMAADPSGQELGLFQSTRVRLFDRLTAEVGFRYDHRSHTGDNTLSPRVNVAVALAPRTTLRGAWGHFYQSHGIDELDVADGDDRFFPVQRAEHRVFGLEHRLVDGTSLRVEAYDRRITDPRPEYRSLVPIIEALWEEGDGDRIRVAPTRGKARGIEFLARRDVGGRVAWSASYVLARSDDEIDGEWVPRPYDQRHTIHFEIAFRPTRMWSVSYAWQYHSGWPGTREYWDANAAVDGSLFLARTFGPINRERLPEYHRLDVRVARLFPIGRGQLEVFVDVFNAYNRKNAEAFNYSAWITPNGRAGYEQDINPLLRIFPTFGARWEF